MNSIHASVFASSSNLDPSDGFTTDTSHSSCALEPMRALSDRLAESRERWTSIRRAEPRDEDLPPKAKRYWLVDAIGAIRRINTR